MRKLIYYVATTLDGFIADPDGGFDAFPQEGDHIEHIFAEWTDTLPGVGLDALGLTARNDRFDTVVMGWNTYAAGLASGVVNPYPHLRQFVFTHRAGPEQQAATDAGLTVSADDPVAVVRALKAEDSPVDVWLCGGGALAATLEDEIDELVLKVNPIVWGDGIRLFARGSAPTVWRPLSSRSFESGVRMERLGR